MSNFNNLLDHAESLMREEFGEEGTLDGVAVKAIIDHEYQVIDEESGSAYGMHVAHIPVEFETTIQRHVSQLIVGAKTYSIGRLVANDGRFLTMEIVR